MLKNKKNQKKDVTYIKTKQFGKFHSIIPFSNNDYSLGKGEEDEKPVNGWKSFRFPLSKVEDDD